MTTGNPQFTPQPPKSKAELKLQALRHDIELWTDSLGEGMDLGIIETVVMLNAFQLPTDSSCEGHPDPATHTKEYHPGMAPWVRIYPEEPDQEGWQDDDELREKVQKESEKYLTQIVALLEEFYSGREVSQDVRLTTDQIAYGFQIQSGGLESLKDPNDKSQQEKAAEYKEEMKRFTQFLKNKFLKENK